MGLWDAGRGGEWLQNGCARAPRPPLAKRYEVHGSFYKSWLGHHPRRSGEAYWNQYWEAKFVSNNPIPQEFADLPELVDWFGPLLEAERRAQDESQS